MDLIQKDHFSHRGGGFGKNVIIFGVDVSSSVHVNNKTRNILVLGKDFIQAINATTIYAEKMYSTNFTVTNKEIWLSLDYNDDNSYLFVNGKKVISFKAKDFEIVSYPLCLGDLSKDFSPANTHKAGLSEYIFYFSVDYGAIANDNMLDIHKYLMKKNSII